MIWWSRWSNRTIFLDLIRECGQSALPSRISGLVRHRYINGTGDSLNHY
ncbi:hypothetical protein [Paenibacillus beijingensis]|nr:hypothetical protein [Paenibacillus beijingensis]